MSNLEMKIVDIRQIFANKDLRNRIGFIFLVAVIYTFLAHVPIPIAEPVILKDFLRNTLEGDNFLGLANLFNGGAISNFSITIIGLSPYITASIIIQLLTQVLPQLQQLSEEGQRGQERINYYTRLFTLPVAVVQAVGTVFLIRQTAVSTGNLDFLAGAQLSNWVLIISTIVAGSMILMWLGELITEKGIGNGISVLIFFSIVAGLPQLIAGNFTVSVTGDSGVFTGIILVITAILTTAFVVLITEAQRNIPISYAKRASISQATINNYLPIRLLTSGVIPIIFALALLSLPAFLGRLLQEASSSWIVDLANWLQVHYDSNNWFYNLNYFILIMGFSYFYTFIIFKPDQIAENLQKQSGFVPGIRPGDETVSYIKTRLKRLTIIGALALAAISLLPYFLSMTLNISQNLTLSGTSLVIIVAVVVETYKQIEAKLITANYDKF
ncbi:preprotein translocase subunit SecY [Candidatus Saccharibacteria bacterium]|nr:preprotein translocase subunit SecY [Candidatus Saccharibacteria bacterium]